MRSYYIALALCLCNCASKITFLNIAALDPIYFSKEFPDRGTIWLGVLLFGYPLAFVILVPFVGLNLTRIGRKNAVVVGLMIIAAVTGLFGIAGYFRNFYIFVIISFIARFIQGLGDGLVCVAAPSIIVIECPKNFEFHMGA